MPLRALSCASALVKPMLAGLGGGIVGLAHLALLAVDRGDVDDAAELALAHAFDHRPGHVEQRVEVGVDHRAPLLRRHAVEHGVAGDAGIVDQHLDRAEIGLDLLEPGGAGLVGRHVPLVDVMPVSALNFCAASSLPA